jgi:hypothetical protein
MGQVRKIRRADRRAALAPAHNRRANEQRDELAPPHSIELHSVPSQGRIAEYRIGRDVSQEVSERVGQQTEGSVLFTSRGPDHLRYEECIGAKKHLVTSPPTGPPPGSKSFATAEYEQWWKRSSGDGVALSA